MIDTPHRALFTTMTSCRRETTPEPCLCIELESETQTLVVRLSEDAAQELRRGLETALAGS